jgi:hypothetical protein
VPTEAEQYFYTTHAKDDSVFQVYMSGKRYTAAQFIAAVEELEQYTGMGPHDFAADYAGRVAAQTCLNTLFVALVAAGYGASPIQTGTQDLSWIETSGTGFIFLIKLGNSLDLRYGYVGELKTANVMRHVVFTR